MQRVELVRDKIVRGAVTDWRRSPSLWIMRLISLGFVLAMTSTSIAHADTNADDARTGMTFAIDGQVGVGAAGPSGVFGGIGVGGGWWMSSGVALGLRADVLATTSDRRGSVLAGPQVEVIGERVFAGFGVGVAHLLGGGTGFGAGVSARAGIVLDHQIELGLQGALALVDDPSSAADGGGGFSDVRTLTAFVGYRGF